MTTDHKIRIPDTGDNVFGLVVMPDGEIAIGEPRLWAKPVSLTTADYGEACTEYVARCDVVIQQLTELRNRVEQAGAMYQITAEIPKNV